MKYRIIKDEMYECMQFYAEKRKDGLMGLLEGRMFMPKTMATTAEGAKELLEKYRAGYKKEVVLICK